MWKSRRADSSSSARSDSRISGCRNEYIRVQSGRTYDPDEHSKDVLLSKVDEIHAQPLTRSIVFNPDYLNDLARSTTVASAGLQVEMFGRNRPIFVSNPSDPDWEGIQMPVRI